jgi:hypothetical protein
MKLVSLNKTWMFRWNQNNTERNGRFGSLYRSVGAILFGKSQHAPLMAFVRIMQRSLRNILNESVKIVQREVVFVHQAMKTCALGCGGVASCIMNVGTRRRRWLARFKPQSLFFLAKESLEQVVGSSPEPLWTLWRSNELCSFWELNSGS